MTWTTFFKISKIILEGLDEDIKKNFNVAETHKMNGAKLGPNWAMR